MKEAFKSFRKWLQTVRTINRWRALLVKRMNDLSEDVEAHSQAVDFLVRSSNRKQRRKFRRIMRLDLGVTDRKQSALLESTYATH